MTKSNQIFEHLKNLKVSDVKHTSEVSKIKTISPTQTIQEAVDSLNKHKIHSLLVTDANGKNIFGLLDISDILSHVLNVAPEDKISAIDAKKLKTLDMFGRAISLEQVSAITNFSGSDPLMPIQSNNKVTVALEAMSRGTQRCIITNEKGEFTGILARTDIIHYIAENIGMLKESANIPISELGLGKEKAITVPETTYVLKALKIINDKKAGGIAIVDSETKKLIGNFSPMDLQGIYHEHYPSIFQNLNAFLKSHSPRSLFPLAVESDITLKELILLIEKEKVHHVWITNADGEVVSIVSIGDLIKYIVAGK